MTARAAAIVGLLALAGCVSEPAGAAGAAGAAGTAGAAEPAGAGPVAPAGFTRLQGDPIDPRRSGRVTALIFITTDCPIANGYAPRIRAMIASFAGRAVDFHLVHVDPKLTVAAARVHAADYGHGGSILLDPQHRLVAWAGASITPEAAVLDAGGTIRYRGRIDNRYGDIGRKRANVSKHDLRDAIEAVLAGRSVATPRTPPVGCVIEPPG